MAKNKFDQVQPKPLGGVRIGHVNLKVSELNRALVFYRDVLGFKVTRQLGDDAAFLAYGDYHHDLCLNTWQSKDGAAPKKGTTGLYHLAILFTERSELIKVYHRITEAAITVNAIVDHGVNESIYIDDPDGNGVELYWDRPQHHWWNADGSLKMGYIPANPETFLKA